MVSLIEFQGGLALKKTSVYDFFRTVSLVCLSLAEGVWTCVSAGPSGSSRFRLPVYYLDSIGVRGLRRFHMPFSAFSSGAAIYFTYHGRRHLLVCIDDFPVATSTSSWVHRSLLCRGGGPKAVSSNAYGAPSVDSGGGRLRPPQGLECIFFSCMDEFVYKLRS